MTKISVTLTAEDISLLRTLLIQHMTDSNERTVNLLREGRYPSVITCVEQLNLNKGLLSVLDTAHNTAYSHPPQSSDPARFGTSNKAYWSDDNRDFYSVHTLKSMGSEFKRVWLNQAAGFPKLPTELANMIGDFVGTPQEVAEAEVVRSRLIDTHVRRLGLIP